MNGCTDRDRPNYVYMYEQYGPVYWRENIVEGGLEEYNTVITNTFQCTK